MWRRRDCITNPRVVIERVFVDGKLIDILNEKATAERRRRKTLIRYCARAGGIVTLLSFLFIALGVISDALNITLVLEPMSWFLLAIIAMVGSMGPTLHVVVAKHLLGIESESKKE